MYSYFAFSFLLAGLGLLLVYRYQKSKGKDRTLIFYGGIAYILVALPMLFSWYAFISIAFIVIGVTFITLNHFTLPKFLQVILLLLPVTAILIWGFYEESSYNIFLIPKGYKGRVVIVHGCKDGTEKEFEGRYRIYRISPNGLLKTKFSFAGNSFDSLHSSYFYVDANGNKEIISQDLNEKDKVIVYGLWTLQHNRKGETNIDFIVDKQITEANSYKTNENANWQKEIDSCRN